MSKKNRNPPCRLRGWPDTIGVWLAVTARGGRQALHRLRHPIPIEVLIADGIRRRTLERELRRGLSRLRRALGSPPSTELAVVVQQVLRTDRQLAGCYQLWQRPDGVQCALLRLALQVNGQHLGPDELLAALAEEWISLIIGQSAASGVLVPVELQPAPSPEIGRLAALRPDPLAPHSNGATAGERAA